MARLVDKYRDEGDLLNVTGNGGVHYNAVRIVETFDDFMVIQAAEGAERGGGGWRGGRVNVNISTITRLETVETSQKVRLGLRG